MSYLELPDGIPDFDKAVISLWFRVPQASIDSAKAQFNTIEDSGELDLNLKGIVPLITFGPNETFDTYSTADGGATWFLTGSCKTSPSLIGILCGTPGGLTDEDVPLLQTRMQYSSGAPPPPTGPSDLRNISPDFFQTGSTMDGSLIYAGVQRKAKFIKVTADHWHHVLVSFELSTGCATSTAGAPINIQFDSVCKFWWAYDDENYDGEYLFPNCPVTFGPNFIGDKNGIVSNYCNDVPRSFAAGDIPTDSQPVGTPTSGDSVEHVYPVELAELQIFTGVTLDTSVEENRRAFVDADGQPVDPNKVATDDDPQSGSIELLGQDPAILLHGSGNWIAGTNTGQMIDNPDYDPDLPEGPDNPILIPDPDFQFTPTGQIVAYSPDPSLYGPQSPTPPPESGEMRRRRRMTRAAA